MGGRCIHSQSSALSSLKLLSARGQHHRLQTRLRVQAGKIPVGEKWWERCSISNMREVSGVQQFVDELATAQDRLVIVDFFAKWCGSCRALFPKLCSIAEDNPEILLLKIDWDENREICKALGIKVLPYFQFYRGTQGKVAAFSASVSKIQRIRDALAEHGTPRCDLGRVERLQEFPDVEPHLLSYPSDGKDGAKNPARELATVR
ncbi:hypothetical protein WJX84_009154 [Apatococcus fuscideae]|uniref:Thioredoxin domain-containing protein n=1 Tax=Apatococcus fuscideae TaxID=2026836 RepID=A0AAW1T9S5_9CHLO